MIGKITNYNLSFKRAYLRPPCAKTMVDDEQIKTKLSPKDEERLNDIKNRVDSITEKHNVDIIGKIFIDEYKKRNSSKKQKDVTLEYKIINKENGTKSLLRVDWISYNEPDKKLLERFENVIINNKKYD